MSEENSTERREESSLEPRDGDQSAHLDALIDQFDDDFDLDFVDETNVAEPAVSNKKALVDSDHDDELDALLSELETGAEPEPVEKSSSSIIVLLGSIVAIAVLGTLIWQDFAGGKKPVAAVDQAATTDNKPAVTASQPVATVVQDQPESDAVKTAAVKAEQPAEAEPMAAAAVKQQEPEMQTEVEAPSATREVLPVDPVAPKVVTAKARKIFWAVNLTSVSTLASAEQIQQGLKNRGIISELKQATIGGKSYYRIRLSGFASKQEAEQARLPLLKEREFKSAWLERYRETPDSPQ